MIIVSSTEPKPFHFLGELSKKPESFGCDFLFEFDGLKAGVQRKAFPSDFISSINNSDRMSRLLVDMQELDFRLMLLEGSREPSSSGLITTSYQKGIRDDSLDSMLFSIQHKFGIQISWSSGISESIFRIQNFFSWCKDNSNSDSSLLVRSKPKLSSIEEKRIFFLSGFDGVGREGAKKILSHCGGVPLILTRNLLEIDGIGAKTVANIKRLLGYRS